MVTAQEPKKKKKKPHPIRDWLVYAAVRILMIFLCLFDVETDLRLRVSGRSFVEILQTGRLRALENLRASFPEKSDE